MEMIADILMVAGTFGAAIYCYVLAIRLKRFSTLETGMGGAIAVLSAQVDDMTKALERAQSVASKSSENLEETTARAEAAAAKLELLVAALHDLPDPGQTGAPEPDGQYQGERKLRFVRRRVVRDDLEAAE